MMSLQKLLTAAAAIVLVVVNTTAAFTTPRVCCSCRSMQMQSKVNRRAAAGMPLLFESPSDQNEPGSKKFSTARMGGRRTKKKELKRENNTTNDGPFAFIRQAAIPILFVALFLRLLFGTIFGGSNVVYYSSTVYQSTTYSRDGNIETRTKESFKSNIPGLVEKKANERSQGRNDDSAVRGSYYDFDSIEDELLDAEEEINSIFGKW